MATPCPNLDAFLGNELCRELVGRAGGLSALAQLSGAAVLHIGLTDAGDLEQAARSRQLRVAAVSLRGARRCLEIIGRKTVLLARADLGGAGGGEDDGAMGKAERERLKEAAERLLREGKVQTTDAQALPAPEIFVRGAEDRQKQRGGMKLYKRRQKQSEQSVLERETARVRMGESLEEQRGKLLARADVRAAMEREKNQLLEREGRKRQRATELSEYDDLLHLTI
eukprot:gene7552-5327_t